MKRRYVPQRSTKQVCHNVLLRDWNGPDCPITVEQFHKLLAELCGIEPKKLANGEWGYSKDQFEEAFRIFGI